jgi:hypothetical protein
MLDVFSDARVELRTKTTVDSVWIEAGRVRGVECRDDSGSHRIGADFVALGCNAVFNPHILLRSGIDHPSLGRRLSEQRYMWVQQDLADVDNFQGSTSITGHGYMFYDGPHRSEHAAALIEHHNRPVIRLESGKWRKRLLVKFMFEEIPQARNRVKFDPANPTVPRIEFHGWSKYTERAVARIPEYLETLQAALKVEGEPKMWKEDTASHVMGTVVMGDNPKKSIVDVNQVHHQHRNLAVLGASSFPSCSPANPTLTICALSAWSASNIFGKPR